MTHLERLVAAGATGDALPSMRELARRLGASPVTLVKATGVLVARGALRTEPGKGTFISREASRPVSDLSWQPLALAPARVDPASVSPLDPGADAEAIPLSHGYLGADLQPIQALQRAASRTLRRGQIWAATPSAGLAELRAVFAAQVGVDPSQVLITPGSQPALAVTLRAIAEPGDSVLVENPTYPGALASIRAAGLRPVPVPTDQLGVRPDYLDDVLARTGARLAYLQPGTNNPTGATLAPERRRAVLDSAAARGALIIEDDWARHLRIDATRPPLLADDHDGHVIHLSSLSKATSPSLRIGFLAARGPVLQRLHTATIVDSLFIARPMQEIALEFLSSPDWPRHLRRLRLALAARRDHLLAQLAERWPATDAAIRVPSGGCHLWVPCPPGTSSTELTAAARRQGIVVGDGQAYFADEAATQHVRLSFGAASSETMTATVARLAQLL